MKITVLTNLFKMVTDSEGLKFEVKKEFNWNEPMVLKVLKLDSE